MHWVKPLVHSHLKPEEDLVKYMLYLQEKPKLMHLKPTQCWTVKADAHFCHDNHNTEM